MKVQDNVLLKRSEDEGMSVIHQRPEPCKFKWLQWQ